MPNGSKEMGANDLDAGIPRGIEFLRRSHLTSGVVKVFMSPDLMCNMLACDSSPFPSCLLLTGLA
jgi:hypothetical protein